MTQPPWIKLFPVDTCPPSCARFITLREHELAVLHLTDPDRFSVIPNSCPHAGGNLSAGSLEGHVITCPWHHWAFDLDTGFCTDSDRVRLRRYDCRVQNDDLYVRLDAPDHSIHAEMDVRSPSPSQT